MFTLDTPARGVAHLCFDSQESITHAMLRFAEYYESPFAEIRGQRFTEAQFLERYAQEYTTEANYFEDWNGYNVPMDSVRAFVLANDTFSDVEMEIIRRLPLNTRYVIATWRNADFEHELAHALYYTDAQYRLVVGDLLNSLWKLMPELSGSLEADLLGSGYAQAVIADEMNAYIATNICDGDWCGGAWPTLHMDDVVILGYIRDSFYRKFAQAQERNRA